MKIHKVLLALAVFITGAILAHGQISASPENTVSWKITQEHLENDLYRILFKGKIADGWHTYSIDSKMYPTAVEFDAAEGFNFEGELYEVSEPTLSDGDKVFYKEIAIARNLRVTGEDITVKGTLTWMGCTDTQCSTPAYKDFSVNISSDTKAAGAEDKTVLSESKEDDGSKGFSWALIIEAILWGFAALLTPCVFPMVPMTVSFFMKGSSSPAAGRFKASMYGLFIVLLYTVPISVIILITWLAGGDAVTADIFNWLATHWFPNLLFFIVFMVFAASFFGAFEIVLPSSLVNKSDKGADKEGLLGVFFMALTLVLVSFSCTGPIVGTVLIKSTEGEFWSPMITMLAFSLAFAVPFTVLALFPSLLKNLPKSGGWLNSVKVVLGFIEVALGF